MHHLDLGPEEVRAALDPKNFPKRHVFLVTTDGDIFVCDIDFGWMVFRRPGHVSNRAWCEALRAAISSMQHHLLVAKTIHDALREIEGTGTVLVFEEGNCPSCQAPSDPANYPHCSELHRRRSLGY